MHVVRVIQALWVILIGWWIIRAFDNKRAKIRQGRGSRLAYLAGALAVVYGLKSCRGLNFLLLPVNAVTQAAGILICAAGVAVAIWARQTLGRNWSGFVVIKQDHELIQGGPYQYVRHPIYTGLILAFTGTFLALVPTTRYFLLELVLVIAFYIKARHEERILAREFGGEYTAYRQRVRGALIPFVL